MSSSSGLLQPNTRFRNRYQVLRVIKAGGMGAVYEVMDDVTATRRALKVMLPSLLDSEELRGKFPGMPEIAPGTRLWAVFAADGRPIMLTDARDTALAGVLQNDLTPVSLH